MTNLVIPEGYEVTSDGRVISFLRGAPRELRQYINGSGYGYPSVWLYRKGKPRKHYAVYRLVAAVYLPARPDRNHVILHLDGDRMNSHAGNLCWGTPKENKDSELEHTYAGHWRRRNEAFEREEYGFPPPPASVPAWPRAA